MARRGGWRGVLALLAEPERVEVRVELDVRQVRVAGTRGVQVEQEVRTAHALGRERAPQPAEDGALVWRAWS